MKPKRTIIEVLLVIIAAVSSISVSLLGLGILLWGGKLTSIAMGLFAISPSLYFIAFFVSLLSRRIGLFFLWCLPFGTCLGLDWELWPNFGHPNAVLTVISMLSPWRYGSCLLWLPPVCMQMALMRGSFLSKQFGTSIDPAIKRD